MTYRTLSYYKCDSCGTELSSVSSDALKDWASLAITLGSNERVGVFHVCPRCLAKSFSWLTEDRG